MYNFWKLRQFPFKMFILIEYFVVLLKKDLGQHILTNQIINHVYKKLLTPTLSDHVPCVFFFMDQYHSTYL